MFLEQQARLVLRQKTETLLFPNPLMAFLWCVVADLAHGLSGIPYLVGELNTEPPLRPLAPGRVL